MPLGYWDQFLQRHNAGLSVNDGGGDGGQGGGGGAGDGGQGAGGQQQKDPPWKSEFGDSFDPNRAWTTIETQRKNERDAVKRAETAERKLKEIEDSGKSELEKTQARAAELEKENATFKQQERESAQRSAIAEEAKKAGAHYPEDIFVLVQRDLDVGEDGRVRNADKVVRDLKQSRPALFQRQSADAGAGKNGSSSSGGAQSINDALRRAAGRT